MGVSELNGIRLPQIQDDTPNVFHQMVRQLPRKQQARIMKRERMIQKVQEEIDGSSNPI